MDYIKLRQRFVTSRKGRRKTKATSDVCDKNTATAIHSKVIEMSGRILSVLLQSSRVAFVLSLIGNTSNFYFIHGVERTLNTTLRNIQK